MKKKTRDIQYPKIGAPLRVPEIAEFLEKPSFDDEENVKALFFAMLAMEYWRDKMKIHSIVSCQKHFPDAYGYRQRDKGRLEQVWIEFETEAHGFQSHNEEYKDYARVHPMIDVCWIDDREDFPSSVPDDVDVISLKDVLEGKEVEVKKAELTEEQKKKRAFLDVVRDEFKKRLPDARIGHGGSNYQQVRIGRSSEYFVWWISNKYGLQVGYHFEHSEKEKNKRFFDWFKMSEKKIAEALGENPIWKEWPDSARYSIVLEQPYDGSEKQKDWAVEIMVKLYNALKPVIRALDSDKKIARAIATRARRAAQIARKAQL